MTCRAACPFFANAERAGSPRAGFIVTPGGAGSKKPQGSLLLVAPRCVTKRIIGAGPCRLEEPFRVPSLSGTKDLPSSYDWNHGPRAPALPALAGVIRPGSLFHPFREVFDGGEDPRRTHDAP